MFQRLQDMANEPDFQAVADRGEGIGAMQPMKIGEGGSRYRDAVDLALELTAKSAAFRSSLPPAMRMMPCKCHASALPP